MELAETTARSEEEVERIVGALLARRGAIADAMVAAIRDEIMPYARSDDVVLEDVRAHCDIHAGLILEVARADRAPRRGELGFAREAAARRVRQGIPLDGLLQAFRVGHRTVWEAILDEAGASAAGRDAAISLARPAMQYIDISSTQVAEAYLKEEQRLAQTADRERRDLLENLLAGRMPPADGLAVTRLGPDVDLLVTVACPDDSTAPEPHALQHLAEALAAHSKGDGAEPLVVVRQREVVAVLPCPAEDAARAASALEAAAEALLRQRNIVLRAGLSTVCHGFAGVARAFEEARQALRRSTPERPVVALTDMSPFEYLVASADAGSREAIAAKGRLLVEADRDGAVSETLLAYVAAGLNVKETAERLVVHPNTVRYRLRRISELTGSDTRRFDHLVDLVTVIRVADGER